MPNEFRIACYMAWSGAEAIFPFNTKEEYERVTASLDKMAVAHFREKELPPGYAKVVTDLYFVDEKDRDAFSEIMKRSK